MTFFILQNSWRWCLARPKRGIPTQVRRLLAILKIHFIRCQFYFPPILIQINDTFIHLTVYFSFCHCQRIQSVNKEFGLYRQFVVFLFISETLSTFSSMRGIALSAVATPLLIAHQNRHVLPVCVHFWSTMKNTSRLICLLLAAYLPSELLASKYTDSILTK